MLNVGFGVPPPVISIGARWPIRLNSSSSGLTPNGLASPSPASRHEVIPVPCPVLLSSQRARVPRPRCAPRLCAVDRRADSHRQHRRGTDRSRQVRADVGLAETIPGARLVPERKVRHLGALGSAMRTRAGRLVCPPYVPRGRTAEPVARRALRPAVPIRFQGCHPCLESGEVGPRSPRRALQARRCAVLLRTGQPPRQPRPLGFEIPAVEFCPRRPAEGPDRRLGEGRQGPGPALRRERPRRPTRGVGTKSRRARTKTGRSRACRTTAS